MISPHVELVIFDCDGVLVDSEVLSVKIDRRVLAEFGWHLTDEQIVHRFVGRSSAHFRSELESHLGRQLPDDWEEPYLPWNPIDRLLNTRHSDEFSFEGFGIPGQTCVASSGPHEKLRHTLGLTGLYSRFEGRIFSATEVAEGKPAPDLFLHAASRTGVPPSRCVVVEDSHSTGVSPPAYPKACIPAARAAATPNRLQGEGTTVFEDMAELPGLLRVPERK